MSSPHIADRTGATALITHRVNPDQQTAYEDWLLRIGAACSSQPQHLDTQIVRPISGLTDTYTVIVRFSDRTALQHWLQSATRRQLIEQVQPLLVAADSVQIRSGLDFWFMPDTPQVRPPLRWKQAVATWIALYPLVLITPMLLLPVVHGLGLPSWRWLDTLLCTSLVVLLMVYLVMPHWTRLIRRWLFR